jgi:rare lipoprotein A
MARVTNLRRRTVVVRMYDRGPFMKNTIINVSRAAAKQLQFSGLMPVSLEVVETKEAF